MDDALNQLRKDLAGHYEVEQEIGHGGMAVVYLAKDLRHHRRVAIKVLRQDVGGASAERFLREIRTVGGLHHPHILPLHDSGTAGDHLFYVMPYVEGETIRQRLEREGPLPVDEAVRIARELADALAFAHARGIVHRDIKPENVFLSAGHALVADFGIARAAESAAGSTTLTDAGLAVGTPSYMSPEQATADPRVDGRSDQYALGCVLYEMLAGAPPFTGPTSQAIMARHTADPVPPLRTVRDVPVALESAIVKSLAKMPADRWPSVDAFATRIGEAVTVTAPDTPVPGAFQGIGRWTLGAVAATALIGVLWQKLPRDTMDAAAAEAILSVAVTPFVVRGDTSYTLFAEGLADGVFTGLVRVAGLSVKGGVLMLNYRDRAEDPLGIGRELGVSAVVTAVIQAMGNKLRVRPQLLNVTDGSVLWGGAEFDGEIEAEGRLQDLFGIQDSITLKIVDALRPQLTPTERGVAARGVHTRDAEAYRLWLESRRALREGTRESSARAVALLQQAIARDSSYSDAWAALAEAMTANDMWRGTPPAEQALRGRTVAQKAIDLDPLNGFAYVQRGWWRAQYDWAWADAWGDFRQAIRLAPASPEVAANYAGFLNVVTEPESAVVQSRRALTMDSSNPGMWTLLGSRFMLAGLTDSGIVAAERAVALNATDLTAHTLLMLLFAKSGRTVEAARQAERVWELDGEMPNALFLATYYRLVGDTLGARRLLSRIRERPANQFTPYSTIAAIQLALGNRATALDGLEQASKERDLELPYCLLFWFRPLQDEPRFERLRQQVFGDRVLAPSPF